MTADNWTEIAEAYGTPPEDRTERQIDIADEGLCSAAWRQGRHKVIGFCISQLRPDVSAFDPFEIAEETMAVGGWRTPLGDSLRCLMACLLAAMTDAERKEIGL